MTEAQRKSLARRAGYADRVKMIDRMLTARVKGRAKSGQKERQTLAKQLGVNLDN
jgi:hypothetical protein